MALKAQDIINRAKGFSVANPPLASDPVEMLQRIDAEQQALSAAILADKSLHAFYTYDEQLDIAAGAVSLASLVKPLGRARVLELVGEPSRPLAVVEPDDLSAAFAPRAVRLGMSLKEATAGDWGAATKLRVVYVARFAAIDTAQPPTAVSIAVPDEYADVLALPLALYLAQKDVGRGEEEKARLDKMAADRREAYFAFLRSYAGTAQAGFDEPEPGA